MPRRVRSPRMTRERIMSRIPEENQRRADLGYEPFPVEEELLIQGYHGVLNVPEDWRSRRNDGTGNLPAAVKRLRFQGELANVA